MKYDINNGFLLIGPNNCGIPGSTQWLAEPFISKGTRAVTKVMPVDHQLGYLHTDFEQVYGANL